MSERDTIRGRRPRHPFWCDDCGGRAGFAIRGCPIDHEPDCPRRGEDAERVHQAAVDYVKATGRPIP